MKALKASVGMYHSLILFEDKNGKELLYSAGVESQDLFAQLGVA